MKRLGISIYPDHMPQDKTIEYLQLAAGYGFKRVFSCLLSAEGDRKKIISQFQPVLLEARALGMEIILDAAPSLFKRLNLSYDDLSFFKELGAAGIRLDEGFDGFKEAAMTYNRYELKIELNMSSGTKQVENVMCFKPDPEMLIGCHNFYPQTYTGLSRKHFLETSKQFKDLGLRTSAFISSQTGRIGPWPVSEGLCTLEEHRNLPVDVQAKDMFSTDLIDDVIIGNAFASEAEIRALSTVDMDALSFTVDWTESATDLEKKIVLEEPHFNRGDVSDYLIRSTQSRVKYKDYSFPSHDTKDIRRGDILIINDHYGHYRGELQIALKDMPSYGNKNIVGRIPDREHFLLDQICSWSKFMFSVNKNIKRAGSIH
jgi:uncharacterized protein